MIGFGAQLSLHPPAEQFELVQRLEAVGYDSVWTGDHMSFHNPIHESITLLASYVPITRRIKLGVGVYLLALRSPAARIWATVSSRPAMLRSPSTNRAPSSASLAQPC